MMLTQTSQTEIKVQGHACGMVSPYFCKELTKTKAASVFLIFRISQQNKCKAKPIFKILRPDVDDSFMCAQVFVE